MVRRRGHSRRSYAWLRIKQYNLKYTHHIVPFYIKLQLDRMTDKIEKELGWLDYLEVQIFAYLETQGVDPDLWKIYMGFAKRVYNFYTDHYFLTAVNETAVLLEEYVLRGQDQAILEGVRDIAIEKADLYKGRPPPPSGYLVCTEVDPNNKITQTANRASWANLDAESDTYLYCIHTDDPITDGFEHKLDFRLSSIDVNTDGTLNYIAFPWYVSNVLGNMWDLDAGIFLAVRENGASVVTYRLRLISLYGGNWPQSGLLNVGQTYYLTMKRNGNVMTCDIHLDVARTILLETLTETLANDAHNQVDWNYLFTSASYGNPAQDPDETTGYVENLILA